MSERGRGTGDQFSLFEGASLAPPSAPAAAQQAPRMDVLPDAAARERIRCDLDTSLLVEAGAGAGKTTEMVRRMVALIATGRAAITELAAVTFTRKAAGELRERFQEALEAAAQGATDPAERARLASAAAEIDGAFIGTIHAFCARVLREHPLEAGLDPRFQELQAVEEQQRRREAWNAHIEALAQQEHGLLERIASIGVRPRQLYALYETLIDNSDIEFQAPPVARPDVTQLRRRLTELHDSAREMMPAREPAEGWDKLQRRIRELTYHRYVERWERDVSFFSALAGVVCADVSIRQRGWGEHGRGARQLAEELREFGREGGAAHAALMQWYAHRYPIVLELARGAAESYAAERRRAGTLSFQDLLVLTAELLERSVHARRSLASRYRFLLVDEFQDTDPIQARVLMLIAADDPSVAEWTRVRPRPGALFVVGDPKQSIYRFRRADIAIYNQVRARFEQFGAVLSLVANFRSQPAVGEFVNRVFARRFPADASDVQAAFSELRVQKDATAGQGVWWYRLNAAGFGVIPAAIAEDAERIASWIRMRIDAGERTPGSFMILTRSKRYLDVYARALEARSVPVQTSGAAVGVEEELSELKLLLRSLADPGDSSLVLAVLTGLFFGIDYESLVQHVVDRKRTLEFHSVAEDPGDVHRVAVALRKLKSWWELTQRVPADVAVPAIVDELGLLVYAAAGQLGETRAGSLLYALDAIRVAALRGDTSLAAAIRALESAYTEDDAEAPLEPGRPDVVRIMNLHKAKGLEADVVILADPRGEVRREPKRYVERSLAGSAVGWLVVSDDTVRRSRFERIIAQPLEWPELAALERRYEEAEADRLLYVAATRAREELLISHWDYKMSPSPWATFHPTLLNYFPEIAAPEIRAPVREQVTETLDDIDAAAKRSDALREAAAVPSYRVASVTRRLAEGDDGARMFERYAEGRGARWGSAVHSALELAGRGLQGDGLRTACISILTAGDAPVDRDGSPLWLDELLRVVAAVRTSSLWQRAEAASTALREAPFAVRFDDDVIEGTVDLAFREADGWVLVDFKTDAVADPDIRGKRLLTYRRQLDLYARCWSEITREAVKERCIVFTASGETIAW